MWRGEWLREAPRMSPSALSQDGIPRWEVTAAQTLRRCSSNQGSRRRQDQRKGAVGALTADKTAAIALGARSALD